MIEVSDMSEIAAWAIMCLGAEQCHDSPVENYLKNAFISPNMQLHALVGHSGKRSPKAFLSLSGEAKVNAV